MNGLLNVSSAPHIRSRLTTGKVMYDVILALLPASVFGVYLYGLHAFLIIGTSIVSAVLTDESMALAFGHNSPACFEASKPPRFLTAGIWHDWRHKHY